MEEVSEISEIAIVSMASAMDRTFDVNQRQCAQDFMVNYWESGNEIRGLK